MKVDTTLKIVGIVLVASLAITTAVYFVDDWKNPIKGEWKSGMIGGYDNDGKYTILNLEPIVLDVKVTKDGLFSGTFDGFEICGTNVGETVFFEKIQGSEKTSFFGKLDNGVIRGAISKTWNDGAACYAAEFSRDGQAFPEPVPTVEGLNFKAVDGKYMTADNVAAKDLMGYGEQYTSVVHQTGGAVYGYIDIVVSGEVRRVPMVGAIVDFDLDFAYIYVVNNAGSAGMYKIYKNSAVFFTGIAMADIESPVLKRTVFDRYYEVSDGSGIAVVWTDLSNTEWKCVSEKYISSNTPGKYESSIKSIKFAPNQSASMIRGVLKFDNTSIDMAFSLTFIDGIKISSIFQSGNNVYGTFSSDGKVMTLYGAWRDTDMHSCKYVFERV